MLGMSLHKQEIPVDYCHDEEIGFLDKFRANKDGLKVYRTLLGNEQTAGSLGCVGEAKPLPVH